MSSPGGELEQLGLYAQRIEVALEVESLRQIRNACRAGFSNNTGVIAEQEQQDWWIREAWRGRVKAWLYYAKNPLVGYGLLRQTDDGRWWASVAVLPEHQGNGYGGAIMADLVRRAGSQVWSTARADNVPAQRLHRSSDWEEWHRDERLVHYRTVSPLP